MLTAIPYYDADFVSDLTPHNIHGYLRFAANGFVRNHDNNQGDTIGAGNRRFFTQVYATGAWAKIAASTQILKEGPPPVTVNRPAYAAAAANPLINITVAAGSPAGLAARMCLLATTTAANSPDGVGVFSDAPVLSCDYSDAVALGAGAAKVLSIKDPLSVGAAANADSPCAAAGTNALNDDDEGSPQVLNCVPGPASAAGTAYPDGRLTYSFGGGEADAPLNVQHFLGDSSENAPENLTLVGRSLYLIEIHPTGSAGSTHKIGRPIRILFEVENR